MTGKGAPDVSVIVPAFDAGETLHAALASIKAQTFKDYEVIVIDDGSAVSPEPLVRRVLPEAVFVAQANQGPSAARNRGIARAQGRFLAFLDADDVWPDSGLESLRNGFRSAPAADMVQGHIKRIARRDQGIQADHSTIGRAYLSFNVGAVLLRKTAIERIGLFDETLRQSEDVDLHIRFKRAGLRKLAIPDTVLLYRLRSATPDGIHRPRVLQSGHPASWMRLLSNSLARRRSEASRPPRPASSSSDATLRTPPVTAVLTVKNARKFLPTALSSIRAQERSVQSIYAVVAESRDGSREYLEKQGDILIIQQSGGGLAQARNQAIRSVTHGLVAFLDCDDLWHPEKIKLQLEAMSMFEVPAFCITNFRRVRTVGPDGPESVVPIDRREFRLGLTPSALLADKTVFEAVGGFDPELGNGCDTDWFSRALRSGVPCAVVGQALMYKRLHESNLSVDPMQNRRDMFRIIEKRRRRPSRG